jgi:hypothetical protein
MLPSSTTVEGGGSVTRGLPDTKPAAFKREIRWNHAYDFLDRGV